MQDYLPIQMHCLWVLRNLESVKFQRDHPSVSHLPIPPSLAIVHSTSRLSYNTMPSTVDDRLENIKLLSKLSKDVADSLKIPFLSIPFAVLSNVLDAVQVYNSAVLSVCTSYEQVHQESP